MKHYKAILCIHNRITDLQVELKNLDEIQDEESYAGYVFVQNDIENIECEIKELTETMQHLISLNKKQCKHQLTSQNQ